MKQTLKLISLLAIITVIVSSCSIKSPVEISKIDNIKLSGTLFKPSVIVDIAIENNLKKPLTINNLDLHLGNKHDATCSLEQPITIQPQQTTIKLPLSIKLSPKINPLELLTYLKQTRIPVEIQISITQGKRQHKFSRKLSVDPKQFLNQ